jgi:hypothetical protein
MAVPGPGLSLIPEDGATRTAVAQQLACWARQDNGLTDPRIRYLTCKAGGYYYIPPEVCAAGYGPLPFTSEGNEIVCDPEAVHQMDRTIWPEDVAPINVDTCTTEGVQLATPTGLILSDITDTGATLAWNAVPGASGYEVQVREATGDWGAATTVTDPTYALTGLTAGTAYQVRVRAIGEGGYVPSLYAVAAFSTTGDTPVPEPLPAPTGLAAGTATATDIPLTWTAVAGADGYVVRWAPTGTTTWTSLPVTAETSATITGLTASTGYDIQVQAQDSTGAAEPSPFSATVTATTAAALAEAASSTSTRKKSSS